MPSKFPKLSPAKFDLPYVEAMCVLHCRDCMSVHNAVDWFVQAHVHGEGSFVSLASWGAVS